jgi:hypothetical protein
VIEDLAARVNYLTTELDRVRGLTMMSSPGVDAAKRENPQAGIVAIPYRHDGGQDGFIRVSKDGVITSYVNPLESDFPHVDIASVGNVTTGLDQLHAYTLKRGTLANNGDYIDIMYGGSYANTEADKQVRMRIDSQLIISFGAVIDLENANFFISYRIIRTSPTQVFWMGTDLHVQLRMADGALITTPSGHFNVPRVNVATVSNMDTTDLVIDLYGEGTNTNDVVKSLFTIDLHRTRELKTVFP